MNLERCITKKINLNIVWSTILYNLAKCYLAVITTNVIFNEKYIRLNAFGFHSLDFRKHSFKQIFDSCFKGNGR
jgi:hypothetical protein